MRDKRLLALAVFFLFSSFALARAEEGKEILKKSIHRKNFKDAFLKVDLEKQKGGLTKKISLELYQKNYPEFSATLAVIQAPESAKGISFLTWNYLDPEKSDLKWYYLPAINQYKELNDEQGRKYEEQFGFSMEIFAVNLEEAEHKLLGEEAVEGKVCYKIESRMKNPDNPHGARAITWVNKETLATEKIQAFDKAGKLIKDFRLLESRKYLDFWQELAGVYQDLVKAQVIKFQITEAQFNQNLKDELFLSTKLKPRAEEVSKSKSK